MRRARGQSPQDGSALIIALVFVTAIALMVGAVLAFADVGVRASKTYRQKSELSYAADGAVAAAVKHYSTTGPCENFTAPMVKAPPSVPPARDKAVNGQGVIVRCQGPPPAGSKAIRPVNSLLSLGTGNGDGTGDGITSNKPLRLLGDVFSNTTVSATAKMIVQGEVSAKGDCTSPMIETVPFTPLHCSNTVPPSPADESRGRDPDYTTAMSTVPVHQGVPRCEPSKWLIRIKPGYYDDAGGLNALTASTTCNNKVVLFEHGVYYFDFGFAGGPNTWKVDNASVTVVGGTPGDWEQKEQEPTPPKVDVPGSCKAGSEGVQLIAGGATRLEVLKGRMELCATPSTTDQQIALFGLGPQLPLHTLEATDIIPDGFTSFLNAQTIGETPLPAKTARAELKADTPSARLAFKAFRPKVPSGSKIDTVDLVVKDQAVGGPVVTTATAGFPGRSCGSQAVPPTGPIPLGACVSGPEDLAALNVTYETKLATGATSATVDVDGVVVEVRYRAPVTRKPTVVQANAGFANPGNALEIGEQATPLPTADADLVPGTAASVTLAGFGDPPLAANAIIESAVLRVAHAEEANAGKPRVTVPVPLGTCTDLEVPKRTGGITDDRIPLKGCLKGAADLKDLTVKFTATDGRSQLDGIWLEVVSSPGPGDPPPPPVLRRAASASSTEFKPPGAALQINESPPLTADATLSTKANTASLSVADFKGGTPLPAGSAVRSAKLKVAHQDDTNVSSVMVTPSVGNSACPTVSLARPGGGPVTGEVDLHPPDPAPPCLTSTDQLAELKATFTATGADTGGTSTQVPKDAKEPAGFVGPDMGREIDNSAAIAPLSSILGPDKASVRLTGFAQLAPPDGSTIDTATLHIAHKEDGALASAVVAFTDNQCKPEPPRIPSTSAPGRTFPEETIDLGACGLTKPSQLSGLSVLYQATLATGVLLGTAALDGVELVLTYSRPAIEKLDGIELDIEFDPPALRPLDPPALRPFCAASPSKCDLLQVGPDPTGSPPAPVDPNTRFVAGGTIYAPSAAVGMSMAGIDHQVLRRGLIARSIRLGLEAKEGYDRPIGLIPPEIVTFTAYPDTTLLAANAVSPPPLGFRTPENAKALREEPVDKTADANLNLVVPSASIDLSGYQTDPPADLLPDAATLRVRHQDDGNTGAVTVKSVRSAVPCFTQALTPSPGRMTEEQVDLRVRKDAPADDPCDFGKSSNLKDLTVTYAVERDPVPTGDPLAPLLATATAKLDGITLEILTGPLVRAGATFDREKATVQSWKVLR